MAQLDQKIEAGLSGQCAWHATITAILLGALNCCQADLFPAAIRKSECWTTMLACPLLHPLPRSRESWLALQQAAQRVTCMGAAQGRGKGGMGRVSGMSLRSGCFQAWECTMAGHAACINCPKHACASGVVQHARMERCHSGLHAPWWARAGMHIRQRSSAPLPPRQNVQLGQAGALQARCIDGLERTAAYLCAPSSALHCKGTAAPAPAAAHDTTLTRRRGVAPLSVALCYHRRS